MILKWFKEIKIFLIVYLILISCNFTCNKVQGIDISVINEVARAKGYLYCSDLKKSLRGDSVAIRRFATYDFTDAMGYEHGRCIVELIDVIGEQVFKKAISNVSSEEKKNIKAYISVDLQFGHRGNEDKNTIKKVYPILSKFFGNSTDGNGSN